jgi:hypothetical protein
MTPEEEIFVRRSVRHQVGELDDITFSNDPQARHYAESCCSGQTIAWDTETRSFFAFQGKRPRIRSKDLDSSQVAGKSHEHKSIVALREIVAKGGRGTIIVDMQDRRVRSIIGADRKVHPVYCFNRLAGQSGKILWPRPHLHDLGTDKLFGGIDPQRVAWTDKFDKFVWRGNLNGRSNPTFDPRQERERIRPLLRKLRSNKTPEKEAIEVLRSVPRFRFVDRFDNDPRSDVGFAFEHGSPFLGEPILARHNKPRIGLHDQQQFKYIAVLRGVDVGSSFYWTMNSGSVGLVMEQSFETFASVHFEPWVHYVPFKEDLSDFEENFAWCQTHQGECQEMVRRASEVCKLLARADLRDEILRRVVAEVNRLTGQ